ncbi:MAG: hypothetical protein IPN13_11795 [Bacteroidetes bacterium]|nr:hypothetical protein [Bacteroidota bacterium]
MGNSCNRYWWGRGNDIGSDFSGNIYVSGPFTFADYYFCNYSLAANYYNNIINKRVFSGKVNKYRFWNFRLTI